MRAFQKDKVYVEETSQKVHVGQRRVRTVQKYVFPNARTDNISHTNYVRGSQQNEVFMEKIPQGVHVERRCVRNVRADALPNVQSLQLIE